MVKFQRGNHLECQCGYKDTNTLTKKATHLKDDGGQSFGSFTQSIPHVVIRTVNFPFIKNTDKKDTNYDSGNDGTDSPLKIGEVAPCCIDHPGDADKGNTADFSCDDRS